MEEARPCLLSRTTGPPSSNVCTFKVDVVPEVGFCAYALPDGAIVVQQVRYRQQ
jgi:hypothetical protein